MKRHEYPKEYIEAVEREALRISPAPRLPVEALDPLIFEWKQVNPTTHAAFAWVWQHLHEWREDTNPPDEVWDDICERMAEEASFASSKPVLPYRLSGTYVGTHPREWAQSVRNLPKFRSLPAKQ